MRTHVIAFEDLSDSREMLEAKPPMVLQIFLYLLLVMVITGLVYIRLASLDVVIKAAGVVRPVSTISVIKSLSGGNVGTILFEEDQFVNQGDTLFTIDPESLLVEEQRLSRQLAETEVKLKNSLLFLESLKSGDNLVPPSELQFYNRFINQSLEEEGLRIKINKARRSLDKEASLPSHLRAGVTMDSLKTDLRYAQLNLESHQSGQLVQITTEIEQLEAERDVLSESLRLNQINLKNTKVTAPISGRVQTLLFLNPGDLLSPGQEIVKIIPDSKGPLKVELAIPNSQIANLREGAYFRMNVAGLPRKEFGLATGVIETIPGDISSSEGFYRVEARLNERTLQGKRKEAPIRVGMMGDARIIVRRQLIWDLIMEKLDFK